MLARLLEMDARPLTETRAPENRIVGCCRDFSVLFCSMLRHFGIPARTRSGFANYFIKDYWMDHVVVEYWTGDHWQLVDSEIPPAEHWGLRCDGRAAQPLSSSAGWRGRCAAAMGRTRRTLASGRALRWAASASFVGG
ncbi:MAG: transglutaminase-like domain-containing protein [Anaerolineae bacterium]